MLRGNSKDFLQSDSCSIQNPVLQTITGSTSFIIKYLIANSNHMAESPKSNRREFLRGRAALKAVRSVVEEIGSGGTSTPQPQSARAAQHLEYLVEFEKRAMACQFQIMLPAGKPTHGPSVALQALNQVDQWEQILTVYRSDSNLNLLNEAARSGFADIDEELQEILALSFELSEKTDGAFDITAGPLSTLWGWQNGRPKIPDHGDITRALNETVGFKKISFRETQSQLKFQSSQMQLNLGGIGKGYTLDQCTQLLKKSSVDSFLMHAGNSSIVARGAPNEKSDAWKIKLRHPIQREVPIADIMLRDVALSTSGVQRQGFYSKGKLIGHILDPRTGYPPDNGVLSVTVIAPTAALADALSTAFFVMGPEQVHAFCMEYPDVGAMLLTKQPGSEKVVLQIFNLQESQYVIFD
jgi:FAD:protein FMN transferase